MGLYRVLLADDEEEIREGIVHRVDWKELGFEIAAFAENGMEALEMMEREMTDVIMTDIRMPFLNGLEFIEKVIEICPTVKLIIFSGFDDFEYAQKAIHFNVEAYMLKPISAAQLRETLLNIKKKLDEERERCHNIELLKKNYVESLPIMKEQFLISWVEGRISEEDMQDKARQYDIELKGSWRIVVLFKLNSTLTKGNEEISKDDSRELQLIALKRAVDSVLGKFHVIHSFIYVNYIVVITELEWESQTGLLMNEVNEVCKIGKKFTGNVVTAGIGRMYKELEAVRASYREACNALEYSTLLCKDGAYTTYIQDIEPEHNMTLIPNHRNEQLLISAIKVGDSHAIQAKLDQFFSELEGSCMPFWQYQVYISKILTSILEIANTFQIDYHEMFFGEISDMSDVLKMHSLQEIKSWMTSICLKISTIIHQSQVNSSIHIVSQAKSLVEKYYTDDTFCAEKICGELHISTAYFSTVFKREEKVNFVTYLTDVRLKHALHLLETTFDKTYIIASKVGYSEPNYFSYVFKKKYGVSPSKYRNGLELSK